MKKKQIIGIGIVVVLIAIYFGTKMYASNVAEERVNLAIAKAANLVDVDYKKVSVDLLGMDVRITNILVSPAGAKEKIKIDEIIIHDIGDKSDIATFLSVSINGIELNLKELGKEAKGIRELGYTDKLLVNLNADYIYEKRKKELNVKKIGIGADDAGEINVSFHLGNIDLNPKEILGILFTYPQIILYEARVTYEDESLAERLIKLGAKQKNIDAKEFKIFLIQKIEKEIEREKDDFIKKALVEIKKFIDDPEEFSISVSPSKPYPLGRIMRVNDPKELIKLLNIRIKS